MVQSSNIYANNHARCKDDIVCRHDSETGTQRAYGAGDQWGDYRLSLDLDIDAVGDYIAVTIDGALMFEATDARYPVGTVALYSAADVGAVFDHLVVTAQDRLSWHPPLLSNVHVDKTSAWSSRSRIRRARPASVRSC